ncbi:sphingosine kinase [Rhodotorula toruloides]|uniref:Sphingosine kinase n=1 Tax=Rhodotorula toruloides TaxID=5286 RepID=A0A511KB28_RHOTO|nr:sphingosine kinase [Rhodotorula toruloides]
MHNHHSARPRDELVVLLGPKPINLALTLDGLVVVKSKKGSLHSLKLSSPSSTSTRLIPYLNLLSARLASSAPTSSSKATSQLEITVAALVPREKGKANSPLKLWILKGRVYDSHVATGDADGRADAGQSSAGESVRDRAEQWCRDAEERAYAGIERSTERLYCVVNPAGGKGLAKKVWEEAVKPMLDAADCAYDVAYTGPPGSPTHAVALARSVPLATYSTLLSLSGDGIIHELLNGLAMHSSGHGKKALRETTLCHVPCGSGNALASSLVGSEKAEDVRWCALAALKGQSIPLDLCSFAQPSIQAGNREFSFLTQAFGLMADLDLGTEHLRALGDLRFTLGYVHAHAAKVGDDLQDDDLPPAKPWSASLPPPDIKPTILTGLPSPCDPPLKPGWYTFDLTKKGVFFLYGGKVPLIARDVMLFPAADPNDGLIDLVLVGPMGRIEALTAMDSTNPMPSPTQKSFLSLPAVTYLKVRSYHLSFPPPPSTNGNAKGRKRGFLSVDGESKKYEEFRVEVHRGLARVRSLGAAGGAFEGQGGGAAWVGRRKIAGFDQ